MGIFLLEMCNFSIELHHVSSKYVYERRCASESKLVAARERNGRAALRSHKRIFRGQVTSSLPLPLRLAVLTRSPPFSYVPVRRIVKISIYSKGTHIWSTFLACHGHRAMNITTLENEFLSLSSLSKVSTLFLSSGMNFRHSQLPLRLITSQIYKVQW